MVFLKNMYPTPYPQQSYKNSVSPAMHLSCIHKRKQIIISRFSFSLATPFTKTIKIGTESQYNWSRSHHRLVKMSRSQLCLHFRITSTTTLYNCILPIVAARKEVSSISFNKSTGISCALYLRIVRLFFMNP